jgi:hypothetical protein
MEWDDPRLAFAKSNSEDTVVQINISKTETNCLPLSQPSAVHDQNQQVYSSGANLGSSDLSGCF